MARLCVHIAPGTAGSDTEVTIPFPGKPCAAVLLPGTPEGPFTRYGPEPEKGPGQEKSLLGGV